MKQFFILLLCLIGIVGNVLAQDACPVAETVINEAIVACSDTEEGEACFGHGGVTSVLNCEDTIPFETAGDKVLLDVTCNLRLSPMQSSGEWGLVKMRVPYSTTDHAISYVLVGGVQLQNAGSSRSEKQVFVKQETVLHSGPGSNFDVIGTLGAESTVSANACNCTGNWLRTVLEDGRIGWMLSNDVVVLGDASALPVVKVDTPVYEPMQAFLLYSNGENDCADSPSSGVLMQVPSQESVARFQVNGVDVSFTETLFLSRDAQEALVIDVLGGQARVSVNGFVTALPTSTRVIVPMSSDSLPMGTPHSALTPTDSLTGLPFGWLERPVTLEPLNAPSPVIVASEPCDVVSNRGTTTCPIHFVNPDGDAITRMTVDLIYAPSGTWEGSDIASPELVDGTATEGRLAWTPSCSLGNDVFIGPVQWRIVITDEAGNESAPFNASFNCVP